MSIPNEALQKLVQEIETRAVLAQQQINVVKTQIAAKQRDVRLLQLTLGEVDSLPKQTKVYEGIGKIPLEDVGKRLSSETAESKTDITNLDKKLHYLETTHKNSRDHIDQIFRSGGKI
ncbi:MAG: hypothetical protein M1827_006515 [Pycnora praestabilis]|nr:MAG: hypothetical protein M1827_006515 [Pycnora praestabilis]